MDWALIKISFTVETREKGTLTFDFTNEELAENYSEETFDALTMKEVTEIVDRMVQREIRGKF